MKTISVVRIAISINTQSRDVARKTTNCNRIRRVAKPLLVSESRLQLNMEIILYNSVGRRKVATAQRGMNTLQCR